MSSSQSVRTEGERVPERPLMSIDLFHAAINGNIRMPTVMGEHQQDGVVIEGGHQTDRNELQHATHSGDTLLHLLVTKHNPLAFIVFLSDMSLLGAPNMMLETPLHSAAKVGNNDFISTLIESHSDNVKKVLRKRNKEEDTAMHVAAKHGHTNVILKLMPLNPEVVYHVNNDMLSPLNIAIIKENLEMVQKMLEVDRALASTPFSDGMFPVHVAARMGQTEMVMHFIVKYSDAAKLLDPRGRNILHIATEEGRNLAAELGQKLAAEEGRNIVSEEGRNLDRLGYTHGRGMLNTMNNAKDYEGNSLLHVAAMKGHLPLMKDIWKKTITNTQGLPPIGNTQGLPPIGNTQGLTPIEKNTHGLTPIDLFVRQLRATTKVDDSLVRTIDQKRLSDKWFNNAMQLSLQNQWERTQIIGLGSVLIITVTFAAAFTIPGGYNQNDGTPLLGKRYMFRAFIIANTFAFIYGFLSLYILLKRAAEGQPGLAHLFAIDTFLLAACSMLVAFGLGLYVTLASACWPLAIIVLLSTFIICILNNINVRSNNWSIGLSFYAVTFLVIFGLAKV